MVGMVLMVGALKDYGDPESYGGCSLGMESLWWLQLSWWVILRAYGGGVAVMVGT